MKRLILDAFLLMLAACLIGFSILMFLPLAHPQVSSGDITFQPNVIPQLTVSRVGPNNESFSFQWNNNTFDIELFFNATWRPELYSLNDFLDDIQKDWNCSLASVDLTIDRNESIVRFGWLLTGVENVSDFVNNAWFKIEDTQPFDYEEIEVDVINENQTIYHLPGNLELSFDDLRHKGFVIGWQNKTSTSVKGFSGASWNLDPIIWSADVIHVAGTYNDLGEDINTAIANSSRFSKQGENQYYSNSLIEIENSSTCTDTYAQVEFNSTKWTADVNLITVESGSTLTLGQVDNVANKATSKGCSILYMSQSYTGRLIKSEAGSTTYLYGCQLTSIVHWTPQDYVELLGSGRVWNCIIEGVDPLNWASTIDVYNLYLVPDRFGFVSPSCDFDDLTIQHYASPNRYCYIYFQYGSGTNTIKNLKANGQTTYGLRFAYSSKTVYLVNPDLDNWQIQSVGAQVWTVYRQYEFDLAVFFENGSIAEGANVTISNSYLDTSDSWLIGSNGSIPQQIYSYGHYNQTQAGIYDYNPYNLTVTLDGYDTYTDLINITKTEDLRIALTPTSQNGDGATFNSVYYLLGGISLLPFSLLFALLLSRRRENGS